MGKPLIERIRDRCKIDPATGCWVWQQGVGTSGYPMMRVAGLTEHPVTVRRLVYAVQHAPVTEGRVITATCGDPLCCAPDHLRSVQRSRLAAETIRIVNERMGTSQRRLAALRRRESGIGAKLKVADAAEIKRRIAAGEGDAAIAKDYPVSPSTIRNIRRGHRWRDVEPARWHP